MIRCRRMGSRTRNSTRAAPSRGRNADLRRPVTTVSPERVAAIAATRSGLTAVTGRRRSAFRPRDGAARVLFRVRDPMRRHRIIFLATVALAAGCQSNKKDVEAARSSEFDADFAVLYSAAIEATRKSYPNLEDAPGR